MPTLLPTLIGLYVLMSLVTLLIYGLDKRRASRGRGRRSRPRVRERTLHLLALLGGWPGALLAQQWFNHKRRKVWFVVTTMLIAAAHVTVWVLWLWRR